MNYYYIIKLTFWNIKIKVTLKINYKMLKIINYGMSFYFENVFN